MNPVAFTLLGLEVRWYGIILAAAIIISSTLGIKAAKKRGFDDEMVVDMLLFSVPAAIVGARAWYVLFNLDYYGFDFMKIINIREGGLAIHGGILFGFFTAFIYCRIKKLDFLKISDILFPFIALGQAIGRWGNFANSEAFGGTTNLPWGIMINGSKVHPTFLYESICDLILFVFLYKSIDKGKFKGQILFMYLIGYSIPRFIIEGMRTDSLMVAGLRTAQITSLVLIFVGAVGLIVGYKSKK